MPDVARIQLVGWGCSYLPQDVVTRVSQSGSMPDVARIQLVGWGCSYLPQDVVTRVSQVDLCLM